ncbi:MAG: neutral/alkaline non-lysosomal ceramidase N-terminal domain-containing protein, partial [Cyclobacteriaceae bacterium]
MRKFLKITFGIIILLLLLLAVLVTPVDWTPYRQMPYYRATMNDLEQLHLETSDEGHIQAGWALANITPKEPVPLVAYKPRGNYEFVQDSSFVKALIFGNGKLNIALLNYELLIVHPALAKTIEEAIKASGLTIQHVYFTATHTHSGMGGTVQGLIGEVAMGGWNEKVVSLLKEKTLEALAHALQKMDTVSLEYKKIYAGDFVANRLVPGDPVDPYIRQMNFKNNTGETCSFLTYSAHATCLNSQFMGLSGDYPHYLTQLRQEDQVDLSIYAAGAVGSHRPIIRQKDINGVKLYASQLNEVIRNQPKQEQTDNTSTLKTGRLALQLRSPHYRISNQYRLRPWIFKWVFGDHPAYFDIVQLGNTLMISSSGEISGVFYENWEKWAATHGLNLIVTTFNGGYIGYITPDKYYMEPYYEVRDMNLYGPY